LLADLARGPPTRRIWLNRWRASVIPTAEDETEAGFAKTGPPFGDILRFNRHPGVHSLAVHGQLLVSQVPFGYLFSGALIVVYFLAFRHSY
jgi:hypothetical protein